jgi:hypothetical protein
VYLWIRRLRPSRSLELAQSLGEFAGANQANTALVGIRLLCRDARSDSYHDSAKQRKQPVGQPVSPVRPASAGQAQAEARATYFLWSGSVADFRKLLRTQAGHGADRGRGLPPLGASHQKRNFKAICTVRF